MSAEAMKKYWADPLCTAFTGRVRSVRAAGEKLELVLEETCFYPEGGGQPADRGTIGGLSVLDVQEDGGEIRHTLAASEEALDILRPGALAACEIDRPYRIQNMRLHTTCHVLFGAARLVFKSVRYAGFDLHETGSLYLETDRPIRPDDLRQMTRLANEAVVDQHPIRSFFISPEELESIPGLAVNLRELPEGAVRVVEIVDWDLAACSGTHLPGTLEIGPIKILNREIHKKNVTRIDYATGRRAVDLMAAEDETLGETAELLGSHRGQVFSMVQKLRGDLQSSQKELQRLREDVLASRLQKLAGEGAQIGRVTHFRQHFDFLDPSGVRAAVSRFLEGRKTTLAVISGGMGPLCLAAGCTGDLPLDLRPAVLEAARKYGGSGGGKPGLVAAGNIYAPPAALLEELTASLQIEIANL